MGVAYYGNYLRWFEMGRAEYLRARGKPYREVEADGLFMPVVEAHVRYRHPGTYDDVLQVWTVPLHIGRAQVKFGYRVVRKADSVLLADGYTIHACMSAAGRVRRFPRELLEQLKGIPTSA
jgi:acyl-CoA thioester hydrolase